MIALIIEFYLIFISLIIEFYLLFIPLIIEFYLLCTILFLSRSCFYAGSDKNLRSNFDGENPRPNVDNVDVNIDRLSDKDFKEWFRGLVDGEGCFLIGTNGNHFTFLFKIYLHKDDAPMLMAVCKRLKVGTV